MTVSPKPGLDASTDQAFAEVREFRTTARDARFLLPFSGEIVAILRAQFPDADPLAWRVLMSAVQSAVAVHVAFEETRGAQLAGNVALNALALAAEELDRESGCGLPPNREEAGAIAREVTRLRGLSAGGHWNVLKAFELLLSFHAARATQEEYAAILAALTGTPKNDG